MVRKSWLLLAAVALAAVLPAPATGRSPSGLHLVAPPTPGRHAPKISSRLLDRLANLNLQLAARADGDDGVDVSVTLTSSDPPAGLDRVGATVYGHRGRMLEARVPAQDVRALAALPGVELVEPLERSIAPDVTSQGVAVMGADQWQAAGNTGAGVKVGVIDGGFGGIKNLVGTEIGAGTQFRCYSAPATFSSTAAACSSDKEDHGTAVAETIADVAPGATLYLASPYSSLDHLAVIDWMAAAGVRVINASFTSIDLFQGPGDGTSPLAVSYYSIVDYAISKGMLWVNAAGNAGGNAWMGAFAPDPASPGWHDFAVGVDTDPITIHSGDTLSVALRWEDSWTSPAADYDLVLSDANGVEVASSKEDQPSFRYPVESLVYTAGSTGTYHVSVRHVDGTTPPIELLVHPERDGEALTYTTPTRSLPSPADSRSAGELTVGAVRFDNPTVVEPYSSVGPTADGRVKPDLVAPDCGVTASEGAFCGTSQAAPHAAGAAALLLASDPSITTPSGLAAALRAHTQSLGGGVNSTSGSGLLKLGSPAASPSLSPSASPGASPGNSPSPSPGTSPSPGPGSPPPFTSAVPPAGATSLGNGWAGQGLATSANGAIVHLAYELEGNIVYRRSTDGGLTFGAPSVIGGSDTAPSMPAIVATRGGLVVVAWPSADAVQVVRSDDYGTNWGTVATVGAATSEGPVAAATDGSNGILVGWTDATSHVVVVQASGDGGRTFGPRLRLGTTSSTPWQGSDLRDASLSLAFGSSGTAYATWMATPNRLVVRRSANGGGTWSSAAVVDAAATRNTIPSVSASGSAAVIAYGVPTARGDQAAIRRSTDGGAHWQARRLVPFTKYGEFEATVSLVGSRTRLAVARCTNSTCSHVGVYFRESSDYGTTWSSARPMSGTAGDSRSFTLLVGRRPIGLVVMYVGGESRMWLRRL